MHAEDSLDLPPPARRPTYIHPLAAVGTTVQVVGANSYIYRLKYKESIEQKGDRWYSLGTFASGNDTVHVRRQRGNEGWQWVSDGPIPR